MKRSWTALAVAILTLGVLAGCNDYNNTVQYNTGATITNLSPSALPAGTPAGAVANCPNTPTSKTNPCFTVLVVALATNGFQSSTLVAWNQNKLPACALTNGNPNPNATNGCSTFVDSTDMTAYVPYSLIQQPGTAYVNTYTPQSGTGNNGLSNALTFIIYGGPNPFPQISSISPTSGNYCAYSTTSSCGSVSITVNSATSGSGGTFLPASQNGGSKVTFTGLATYGIETAINITSLSATQIKATIPGSYLCATDVAEINVINPPSAICIVNCPNVGGGDTNCNSSISEPSPCGKTSQPFTISGTAGANTCPAQSPPNPNPTAVAAETPAISQDGRFVTYASQQNGVTQILLRDTCVGAAKECTPSTETISVNNEGTIANAESHDAVMSSDGRYVAFSSAATNLVANPPTGRQVYLRDTCQGAASTCKPATTLVSVDEEGKLGGAEAILPSISTSGRFVAFLAVTPSHATNGSAANTGVNSGLRQVFVRDTCLGATNCTPSTTRISMLPGDAPTGGTKPAGPAVAGLARQLALTDTKNSTAFTPTVPIDDEVFLAIREKQ